MPVTFEQPVPVQQAQTGGYVEETNKLLQLGLQAQQIAQQGRIAGARIGQEQMASANQAAIASQGLAAQQQPSLRDQYMLQGQQNLQQQREQAQLQNQMALMDQQFSYADQVRYSQMQQGYSQLKQMLDSGQITPEQFAEGKARYAGVMGPEELRQQTAKTKAMQANTEQVMHQQAQITSIQNMNATQRAQWIKDNTIDLGNGNSAIINPADGKVVHFKNETKDHEAEAQAKVDEALRKGEDQSVVDWRKHLDTIHKNAAGILVEDQRGKFINSQMETADLPKTEAEARQRYRDAHGVKKTTTEPAAPPSLNANAFIADLNKTPIQTTDQAKDALRQIYARYPENPPAEIKAEVDRLKGMSKPPKSEKTIDKEDWDVPERPAKGKTGYFKGRLGQLYYQNEDGDVAKVGKGEWANRFSPIGAARMVGLGGLIESPVVTGR